MIRWIVGSSLRLRRPIVAIAAVVVVLGIWQFPTMSSNVAPEFTPPTVEIQTEALGLSAAEVEQLITVPLEQDLLNGVAWLESIRSESVPGLSSIEMIFEPGTPMLRARQVVQERLTQAHALPNVSKPPQMLQPVSSTSRVMMIGLSSNELSAIELSVLARWTVRPNLIGVEGVSNVAIFGQRERQLQVQVDSDKLAELGVTLDQVISSTGNALWVSPLTFLEASTPGAGGFIETPNQRLNVQHLSPIVTAQDLARVSVDGTNGALQLGDVANVVEDHQPLIGDAVFADDPGLLLVIEKFPGASTVEVTERVEAALENLRPGMGGVVVDTELFRPASYIESAINNLIVALMIGAILGALALALLFIEWRSALVSALTVAASAAAAGLVLYLRDTTINSMVVAGLVLGIALVVDEAVTATANATRRLRGNGHEEGVGSVPESLIHDAMAEIRGPALYAAVISAVSLLPLFFLDGLSSDPFWPPVALSYLLAVGASMLVALTVAPALSLMMFAKRPAPPREPVATSLIRRAVVRPLRATTGKPVMALGACVVLVAVGAGALLRLDANVLPTFRESDLLVQWESKAGTSLPEMTRITARINSELEAVPGVIKVGSHLGRAITSDQVVSVNSGELWVRVDADADYDAVVAAVEQRLDGYPGIRHEVLTHSGERINDVLGNDASPIDVRIFGEDQAVLDAKAAEVMAVLGGIDGVVEPRIVAAVDEPSLAIAVDLDRADEVGVKPGDVRRAAATMLQGIEVGALFEDQKVFEVIVKGSPALRDSIDGIRDLMIDTPSGGHVRLGDVADVHIAPTANVIFRDASSRAIDVVADVSGRDVHAVADEVERELASVQFPLAHHAELIGDHAARQDAERRLLNVAAVALVGVLLVLQAVFGSWRLAGVMLITLPAALAGGAVGAWLVSDSLSLGSVAGLFGLLGLAARNVVLLVKRYQRLEAENPSTDRAVLVDRATVERIGTMTIASLGAAVGLAPLLFLGDLPGGEIVQPLAVVMLTGLITMAIVTAFVVPALYQRFAPSAIIADLFADSNVRVTPSPVQIPIQVPAPGGANV